MTALNTDIRQRLGLPPAPAPSPVPAPAPRRPDTRDTTPRERRVLAALGLFRECFPAVFRDPPVPLRVGIDKTLIALTEGEFAPDEIKAALRSWTRQRAYRRAIVPGAVRVDLDGQPAGVVGDGEAPRSLASARNSGPIASPSASVAPDRESAPLAAIAAAEREAGSQGGRSNADA